MEGWVGKGRNGKARNGMGWNTWQFFFSEGIYCPFDFSVIFISDG